MRRRLVPGLLVLLVVSACGDDSPLLYGTVGRGDVTLPNGSMTARFDGSTWNATSINARNSPAIGAAGRYIEIGGRDAANRGIFLEFVCTGAGTYTVPGIVEAYFTLDYRNVLGFSAASDIGGSSGTIDLTIFTATRAAGTFSFIAVGRIADSGIKEVTNGTFDVTF